jgi:UDP-2,4-diacetamido-2,4,6-trideoxy-beta-L-altropyranose hydrolase
VHSAAFDILFRADATPTIGVGHVIRCLSLANALREQGASCAFLARSIQLGQLDKAIESQGHVLLRLAGDIPGSEQQDEDAARCQAVLAGLGRARWLVVDHYALDARWEKAMQEFAVDIMVIDDLANRPHACSLLLDHNLVPAMNSRYEGKLSYGCKQLLGPRFALLRPEFCRQPVPRKAYTDKPRVLVMFGGADPQALSLRVLRLLARRSWAGELDVIAGSLFSRLDELRELLATMPNACLHVSTPDVANLMRQADLAIGSPGVSSWERCSTGLPALALSQADNQEEIGQALADAGAHIYLGRAEKLSDDDLEAALQLLLTNPGLRTAMAHSALAICDGQGTARVARQLWHNPIQMRLAILDDAPFLFSWRNDEHTRRQSLDPRSLQFDVHLSWIKQVLARSDEFLLVAMQEQVAVACVRFSCSAEHARISIYTDPARRGQGLGSAALEAASHWLRQECPAIRVIEAEVLQDNVASHAMFRAAGYVARWTRFEIELASECKTEQHDN